ncbi:MAG: hypothetical protein BGO55_00270 [Sphingobacteriales bacterium 50-39]|nr:hypothetical protein [Sphingobacteriales bacterium]OJW53555.1 MAG: hypothetical protein BGO55_00270 [Sphingobacteriales bacterium 50-39]
MELQLAVQSIFGQLAGSLCQLKAGEYCSPCSSLSGHTVGQHVRHIIELFQALEHGYDRGTVNYEKRKRDKAIETDSVLACRLLQQIGEGLDRPDKDLLLEATYDEQGSASLVIPTNYRREIAYNLEHTIHHMALIRIGIRELDSLLILPEGYGIASSTLNYRRECAQ